MGQWIDILHFLGNRKQRCCSIGRDQVGQDIALVTFPQCHLPTKINPFLGSDPSLTMREDDCFRFKASLGYKMRPCLKNKYVN